MISLKQKRPLKFNPERASFNNPGDFLLSHTVSRAVPSAPAGLTSVFGMGTGVTLPTKSPENFFGSGDPAVRRAGRFRSRTANRPVRDTELLRYQICGLNTPES